MPGALVIPLSKKCVCHPPDSSSLQTEDETPVLWAGPGWTFPLALRPAVVDLQEWLAFLSGVSPVEAGKVCAGTLGPHPRKAL